jgi:hypothetical protein
MLKEEEEKSRSQIQDQIPEVGGRSPEGASAKSQHHQFKRLGPKLLCLVLIS